MTAWTFEVGLMTAGVLLAGSAVVATGQVDSGAGRESRTVVTRNWIPAAQSQVAPLRRVVELDLHDATVKAALQAIRQAANLDIVYGEDVLASPARITLRGARMSVIDALRQVLDGTGLQVFVALRGDVVLVRSSPPAMVQAGVVVGVVTDAATNGKLSGAEVWLERTQWRTTTDTAGRYRLTEVEPGSYTLAVRRFGYAKQSRAVTVEAGREDTVDVALEPIATRLNELVTTATGIQRRLEIANAVTVLRADSIVRTQPIKDVTDLLETRVPGLAVLPTTGAPGDPSRLRLRGSSSVLRSNDPIVIVDGRRIYAEGSAAVSLAGYQGTPAGDVSDGVVGIVPAPSPLDRIDPNSIETVEVLNGPSAAALYGADAANGVILITTKRGRPGPARWDLSLTHGRSGMPGRFPESYFGFGRTPFTDVAECSPPTQLAVDNPPCTVDSVVAYQVLNDPELTVLGQGRASTASATVSGGRPDIRYALTASYSDELGLLKLPQYEADRFRESFNRAPEDWMERPHRLEKWGVTSGLTFYPSRPLKIDLSMSLSGTEQRRSELEQQLAGLRRAYVDKSNGLIYLGGITQPPGPTLVPSFYQKTTNRALLLTTGANFQWQPIERLQLHTDVGLSTDLHRDETLLPRGIFASDTSGRLTTGQGSVTVGTLNARATYQVPLVAGFRLDATTGINYTSTSTTIIKAEALDQTGASIDTASQATDDVTSYGWYVAPQIGNQRFFLNLGLRIDGGNNYGSQAKDGGLKLPRFGFSWLISDEPFFPLKQSRLLNMLRIRAAFGKAGVQPGPQDRLRLHSVPVSQSLDDQQASVSWLSTLGNTQLRPERSTELEGGFDADLLDTRLSVEFTAYRKTKNDALLQVPVAPSVAVGNGGSVASRLINIGVVRNTGMSLTLRTTMLRTAPVQWSTDLQISHNRNVVVSLANGIDAINLNANQRIVTGYPLFGYWEKPILAYADANADGFIQPYEVLVGDSVNYLGAPEPAYTAAFHSSLGLLRGVLAIDAVFDYQDNLAQAQNLVMGGAISRARVDSSAALEDQAMVAAAALPTQNRTNYGLYQTVSVLRFRSVAVRWRLPTSVTRWVGAQSGGLAVQGTNLALMTNYRGKDPAVNSLGTGNAVVDAGALPLPREFRVALNLSY